MSCAFGSLGDPKAAAARSTQNKLPVSFNLLIADDSITDAEHEQQALRSAGLLFTARVVATRDHFVAALKEFDPDIIIVDYLLPGFRGVEAAKMARAAIPERPIILVSGPLDDEAAMEIVGQGFSGYVMKSCLVRLPAAVMDAIHAAHKRKVCQRLASVDRHLASVLKSIPEIVIGLDLRGNVVAWNDAAVEMFGHSTDQAVGQPIALLLGDCVTNLLGSVLQKAPTAKSASWADATYRNKSGKTVELSFLVSAARDLANQVVGTAIIVRDVTQQKRAQLDAQNALQGIETKTMLRAQHSMKATVVALANALERRDPYTAGHQRRVAELARAIAGEMGRPAQEIDGMYFAGLIHDIGKIDIPPEILCKAGPLSDSEFQWLKEHPRAGYDIVKHIDFPWPIADMILQHHERIDGSGYPAGLKGNAITLGSRILAVADVVEAMIARRSYRNAPGLQAALDEIALGSGRLFDPAVVAACIRLFRDQGFSFTDAPEAVTTATGHRGPVPGAPPNRFDCLI